MPIDYQRDDARRLVSIVLTEPYAFDELLSTTDRQWTEDVWEYAVFYDVRGVAHVPPASELQRVVDRVRTVGGGAPRGPGGVAISPSPEMFRGGLQLAKLSGPLRDLEILLNDAQVDAWLTRHAPRRDLTGQS
jgi:hypothetical protein